MHKHASQQRNVMTSFPENIITLFKFSMDQHCFKVAVQNHWVNNMTSIGDVEMRSIVKFCVALEKSPTETIKWSILQENTRNAVRLCTLYRWHARFKVGRNSIEDDPRFGRQSAVACLIKDSVKDSADDLVKHTQAIFSSFTDSWYVETYNKWITRHRKCVEITGDYVEKVRRSMDLNVA